jgi:hypothetical protein
MRRRTGCMALAVLMLIGLAWTPPAAAERFRSLAPYLTETEAVAAGEKLGIGSAVLEGPAAVEVLTHQTFRLVYTAGRAGIAPGGGIRIGMRHLLNWTVPQMDKPAAPGYLTVRAGRDLPTQVYIEYNNHRGRFFQQYHPWQNVVEVILPEVGLREGETVELVYGDRSGGSPGIRVQPFDEFPFVFKTYVDALGDDDYLPLAVNPQIDIVAADPYRLGVVMPSDAVAGEPTWCIVRAEDRYGNPATRYRGTVRLATTDAAAKLPPARTFTEADRGVFRFENVVFQTPGSHAITAADGEFERESNPVRVAATRPELLLLWGDLHGHTLFSDGRGTVEQFYDFAERVAGLDFCAVTDHAFQIMDHMWEHSKKVTNAVYRPGRFVTFQAYEWSGMTDVGGDHNVYFLDDDPPLYRARSYYNYRNFQMYHGPEPQVNHVEDLFIKLVELQTNRDVFCIPHYGGRQGNAAWHNPKVQRMIEIFSEHRRSEDWVTPFLKNRYRLGIMASTDGHFGNPGYGYLKPTYDWSTQEIGMAAVAVYAAERTRESIFAALYDRHVYATSGDRIILDFRADGHVMGSEYASSTPPLITVQAVGTGPITEVRIKKDSEVVHTAQPGSLDVRLEWRDPDFNPDRECYYYVQVIQENNEEAVSSPIWVN